jgi:phosphatidate cytidylyltransferase
VLVSRILTGVVAIPILLVMAFDDGWLFRAGIIGTGLLGTAEAVRMAKLAGHRVLAPFAYIVTLVVLGDAIFSPGQALGPALGLIVATSLAVLLLRADQQGSLTDWALTIALPLYVAGLLQFYVPLRQRPEVGTLTWPAVVMLTSWSCDIAAYFAGRAFGRTRLAPSISPAKSVEGAAAGLVVATLVGTLFTFVLPVDPVRMAGFGLAIGIGSVVGDLAESLIKRQCGVKDSGFLMPGHGGILDRMDALIFSAATAYFYLRAVL